MPTPATPVSSTALPWPESARSSRSRKYVVHVASTHQARRIPALGRCGTISSPDRTSSARSRRGPRRSGPSPARGAGPGPSAPAGAAPPAGRHARRTAGPGEVRLLVDRVRAQQVLPSARQAEQVLVQRGQRVPSGVGRPGLVEVVGQQRAAVRRERLLRIGRGAGRDGRLAQAPEHDRVHRHLVVREQQDLVLAQQDGALAVAECPPRVVRRLVQPRAGGLDADAGPQRVHDPLAVHAAPVGEGEQLHQRGSAASAPGVIGDRHSVGDDGEALRAARCRRTCRCLDRDRPPRLRYAIAVPPRRPLFPSCHRAGCQDGSDSRYSTSSVIAALTRRIRPGTSPMSQSYAAISSLTWNRCADRRSRVAS